MKCCLSGIGVAWAIAAVAGLAYAEAKADGTTSQTTEVSGSLNSGLKDSSAETLAALERQVAGQPDSASDHLGLAEALGRLGLVDRARDEANTALRLDAHSPVALMDLARLREMDSLGRMFEPGFDRDGAVQALRTLARVAPENRVGRLSLVSLLEFDTDGVRYSYNAPLAEAATELLEIRKLPEYADKWDDELLRLLGMSGQFEKIPPLVAGMKMSDYRRGWLVASAFYMGGEKAARAAAGSAGFAGTAGLKLDRAATNRAFYDAAGSLEMARQYEKALQLMKLSTVEAKDAAGRTFHLQILSKIRRHNDEVPDSASPADGARQLMAAILRPSASRSSLDAVLSRSTREAISRVPQSIGEMRQLGAHELSAFTQLGYPIDVAIDMVLAQEEVAVEGNSQNGFVVRMRSGNSSHEAYVVVERGEAEVLAVSDAYMLAGPEALARAEAGLDEQALAVLNWAAKFASSAPSDGPLGRPAFFRFWPIPEEGGAKEIGYAAAALAAPLGDPAAAPVLLKGRSAARSETAQLDFDAALASVFFTQQRWKELVPVAERLSKAYPDSATAFDYRTAAYRGIQEWGKAEAATSDWLARHKDDSSHGIMARVLNARLQGKFHEGRSILAPLVAAGSANTLMLNEYAWLSVAGNEVDDSVLAAARKVSEGHALSGSGGNRTLACALALCGHPKDGLDALIKAMNTSGMRAADSSSWFAQGLMAEAYRDTQSAQLYFSRVQRDPAHDDDPASVFNLAQRRLEKLSRAH
jgi:hypothetical protein